MSPSPASWTPVATHPLQPLQPIEIERFRSLLLDTGLVSETTRFGSVLLLEPHKRDVMAFTEGSVPPRVITGLLTDIRANTLHSVTVDLISGGVEAEELNPAVTGWGPSLQEDFATADALLKSDASWIAAIARRGVTDLDSVRTVALSAGVFGYPDEVGNRVYRVLAFRQDYPTDSVWAHPIDGVVAHVDLTNHRVLRVVETDVMHVPSESGDYLDPAVRGPERTTLKPISITQPEGVSFSLENGVLRWQNWEVRVGFNGREGLTLHELSFTDAGRKRPIMYRGSVAEMVVNYADPTPTHAWQNYFDVGEYQFGRLANSLELGCDCVGEISYLDAVVVDDHGHPQSLRNAICIHEEDYGILWKHSDDFSGTKETRRQRRIVISFFVTVGNYDYGFYWYLYLDGTIQLEAKATGIVFTSGYPGAGYEYATEIAPGLGAPVHQHLFSARLDMTVDGVPNTVDEIDLQRVAAGDGNPWGNAFTRSTLALTRESEAQRLSDASAGRVWSIRSTETSNRMGRPPAYILYPEASPVLFADPESSVAKRAAFASKSLWVTRYDPSEFWPAGEIVNQNPGGAGLPAYAAANRSIEGEDIVLWHTFGLTHFPRPEDWPIMPVDYAGFTMKPHGFFDRNPTIDVPETIGGSHCHTPGAEPDGHDHTGHTRNEHGGHGHDPAGHTG